MENFVDIRQYARVKPPDEFRWILTFIVEFKHLSFNWLSVNLERNLLANLALTKPWLSFFPVPYLV